MLNFNEEKEKYLIRLDNFLNREDLNVTIDETNNPKLMKAILNPKNDIELKYGNAVINFLEDQINIIMDCYNDNINLDNIDNTMLTNYYVECIKTYNKTQSEDDIKKIFIKYENEEKMATIIYEMITIMLTDFDEFINKVAKECNYDIEDDMEYHDLLDNINLISKLGKEYNTETDMNKFIIMSEIFHNIYLNGKKNKKLIFD